ncbi:MAG: carbohydrate ABC transporter permease [Anaerolineae bacterium]|nr:carbohydrate ABC transporter permease [Anaerolineae bacterium]
MYRFSKNLSQWIVNITLMLVSFIFLLPLIVVISASLSDEKALTTQGYSLLPQQFSLAAYEYIFMGPERLVRAYSVTIFVTITGTLLGLLIMSMLAYSLSRQEFKFRKPFSFILIFTMLFSGGLVPTYLLITQVLHLKDNILVLILPYLVIPWFVFILRSFFAGLPQELIEVARVDGASEWRIFFQLVLPLSTPALATVGLFLILVYWNDWWLSLLYINDPNLFPLQYLLYSIMRNAEFLTSNNSTSMLIGVELPTQTLRMAMVVIAMGPIAIAFVALQKYFIRGALIGSLKG